MQRAGNHALLVTVAATLLPHALKSIFDQTRPDRTTVMGHIHGVSFSGKRKDAFPSGHALHMGALASAAGTLPAQPRIMIRAAAIALSLTRVVVLAHWASDVVAGFVLGAGLNASCGFGQDIRSRLQRRAIVMSHLEESPVSTFRMRTRLK